MNRELIRQIDQIVDRTDEQIKCELLAQAEEIRGFIERTSEQAPWLIEVLSLFDFEAKEPATITDFLMLLRCCFLQLKEIGQKPPRWVIAWYKKAYAWDLALRLKS